MKRSLKILLVSSEVSPFAKTGGLGDVSSALPKALKDLGHDVRVITPQYRIINERKYVLRDVIRLQDIEVSMNGNLHTINVKSAFIPNTKVQVYFIDYKPFFFREGLYVDSQTGTDYPDNAARFLLFCLGTLKTLKKLQWQPDVIHCNDWQSGMIPFLLKTRFYDDKFLSPIASLFTIHNIIYQGNFKKEHMKLLDLPEKFDSLKQNLNFYEQFSFMKAGLTMADWLNTVSPTYAKEVQIDPEFGCGMEPILKERSEVFSGVLNGIDDQVWNPGNDRHVQSSYSAEDLSGKAGAKKDLLKLAGFSEKAIDQPLIVMISRLTRQKGCDLILKSLPDMLKLEGNLIVLGQGEEKYEKSFKEWEGKHKDRIKTLIQFDEEIAHQMIAGADIFLMPSLQEPCGLTQMYSLRYGTVPIVRATGGLADTVEQVDEKQIRGTGFVFEGTESTDFMKSVARAIRLYKKPEIWQQIIQNGMSRDFSWKTSAQAYLEIYKQCLQKKRSE